VDDVNNDVMKSAIWKISSYDILETGHLINFVFDSSCLLSTASEPHHLPACYFW